MRIICFLSILLSSLTSSIAQNIRYDVVKGSRNLGSMEVVKKVTDNTTNYKVESNVEIKVLLTFKIYYFLEEFFENRSLKKGNAHNTLNDKMQKQSVVLGDNERYVINLNGEVHKFNEGNITYSIPHLYYEEPVGKEKVFSQQFAGYLPILKVAEHTYEVESPDGANVYKYDANGRCVEVKVSRTFATFYFLIKD
jgi:hypothetical protein